MPWLTTIGLLPTVGALVIWGALLPRRSGPVADESLAPVGVPVGAAVGVAGGGGAGPTPGATGGTEVLPAGDDAGERAASFARWTALLTSLVVFALTLALSVRFDVSRAGTFQFSETHSWIPQFGVSYAVGVDGIALTMVVLSAVLVPICVLAGWREV
ncbi:MAG: NADH-quinone oxidoreductase subunit M, partial [Kineosporiaceae bacterium]